VDLKFLDGKLFLDALAEAAERLGEKRKDLNQINVFPVPDGDTGNNMLATLESALAAAGQIKTGSLSDMAAAAWTGAREGSTGNSGAIFAQFLKGWALACEGGSEADAAAVSRALERGTLEAYSAVLKPAEGTILTVAREAAAAAQKAAGSGGMKETLAAAYGQARKALLKTSKVLPELRSKKIVDAGGWGLLIFLRALLKVMEVPVKAEFDFKTKVNFFERYDYRFENPFDMEFVVSMEAAREGVLRLTIGEFGTELITQTNGNDCHVHIHTQNPLKVVECAAEMAEFSDIVVRDMRSQYRDLADKNEKSYRTVALGKTAGFIAMFAMAGADLALSVNQPGGKTRLLQEYAGDALFLSCKEPGPPNAEGTIILEDEARLLAALVSIYGLNKPDEKTVREAAGYPRNFNLMRFGYTYEARENGETIAKGRFRETLAQGIAFLQPKSGEMLTIYYGRPGGRQQVEAILPYLQDEFDCLDGIELFYGGQDFPLVVSLE